MSGEEQNREFYKETFEEIRMPEGLAEKVGRIPEGKAKSRRSTARCAMRRVAIAAAVLVALFAGSNGIAYAMTGETWVEKVIIRRNTDGVDYEMEAEVHQLKNGETVYYGEYTTPDGKVHAPVDYDGEGPYIYFWFEDEGAEIWSHNGKTYIWDGDMELDISEDFADDGLALGTYVVNGVFKKYGLKRHEDGTISASLYSPPKYTWPDYWRKQ